MAWHDAYVGDYVAQYNDTSTENSISVFPQNYNLTIYGSIPTAEECNSALGTTGRKLKINFFSCNYVQALPRLPDEVFSLSEICWGCGDLLVAPKLPKIIVDGSLRYAFNGCNLLTPATIPAAAQNISTLYRNNKLLKQAASVPKDVTNIFRIYSGCTSLEGEFCIRMTSVTDNGYALADTINTITIYGDKDLCEAVAATANNGNASWQPWYDPVPAVTDRGQGSYTTADDMTRMVRNGVLAVDTYAPGRMVYHQGDIVREDEWEALVEAAQTIDPTVTMSTHYTNLNKIEKAFDDAL